MGRQTREVRSDVAFDLALGLAHEAEARAIASQRRRRADREGTGVPERSEQARSGAELAQPLLAPREVVGFLTRGLLEHRAHLGPGGECGLAVVERLCCDLACVVHPHEGRRGLSLGLRQGGFRQRGVARGLWQGSVRYRGDEHGPQRPIERHQERIQRMVVSHDTV